MKEIILTRGFVALIDDEDYELVKPYAWHVISGYRNLCYYAQTTIRGDDGKEYGLYMHRLIMSAPKGIEVDHRNVNGLDNQRKNLRLCSTFENKYNRGIQSNNTSGFKGVSFHTIKRKFQANIMVNYKAIYLGIYDTAEEAAAAYKEAALRLHGEFARTE